VIIQGFCRGLPAKGLPRPCVERSSDGIEVIDAVLAEVGTFREILPQQAVGVLVRAALPWTVGVAEVDDQAGVDA
jgi:hypothetical protein